MSTPKEKRFFEIYANLIKTLKQSGYAAQIVSALTEVGGIYAAAYAALLPILPFYAMYLAAFIAILGTAVIELGLRKLLPHTVDSILYRRFKGLHLPITILIWVSAIILLASSGILSFKNSRTIVEQVTPDAERDSTAILSSDTVHLATLNSLKKTYSLDSSQIASQHNQRIDATKAAFAGKIGSAKRELSNLYNKEKRSGKSYSTLKDKTRQKIADYEAELAAAVAAITNEKAKELSNLLREHKGEVATQKDSHKGKLAVIEEEYQADSEDRASTVGTYGGGLAYFTIICLIVLIVSIVLDRIHKKGSGIKEKISLSQYDISPSAWIEFWEAIRERWNYEVRSRIYAFAEKTPAAPLPVAKPPIYDSTEITEEVETIKYEEVEEEEKIIHLPRRRRIGFNSSCDLYSTRKKHEKSTKSSHESLPLEHQTEAPKATHETPELRELKQRLKMYKKRLGSHQQKAIKQEEKDGEVKQRTLDAIANNEHWVKHYEELIKNVQQNG